MMWNCMRDSQTQVLSREFSLSRCMTTYETLNTCSRKFGIISNRFPRAFKELEPVCQRMLPFYPADHDDARKIGQDDIAVFLWFLLVTSFLNACMYVRKYITICHGIPYCMYEPACFSIICGISYAMPYIPYAMAYWNVCSCIQYAMAYSCMATAFAFNMPWMAYAICHGIIKRIYAIFMQYAMAYSIYGIFIHYMSSTFNTRHHVNGIFNMSFKLIRN